MKSTGIIKHIDFLGRFKLPRELLESYNINTLTPLKLSRGRKAIIITKDVHNCIFCNSSEKIHTFQDKYICRECVKKINDLV